jgi:D-sedoheptulose 7-phosphate isomerase
VAQKIRKAVIPAAGLGTRLLPFTKTVPKEMLPVAGKPLIQWAVEEAAASGIETVVLVISRNKKLIARYFEPDATLEKDLERAGRTSEVQMLRQLSTVCRIRTALQETPRGLADAIACAKHEIGGESFSVILPDVLFDSGLPVTRQLLDRYHEYNGCVIGSRTVDNDEVQRCGILTMAPKQHDCCSGRALHVSAVSEHPRTGDVSSRYGIAGRYVLTQEIFDCIAKIKPGFGGELQLSDALSLLAQRAAVHAYQIDAAHYDCGNLEGYLQAELAFAGKYLNLPTSAPNWRAPFAFPEPAARPSDRGKQASARPSSTNYVSQYFKEAVQILDRIDETNLEEAVELLLRVRQRGGRLFFLGVGGSAANASHAVNDFRKLAHIECYTPTDNVAELTARINDDGWETAYRNWLEGSRLNKNDAVFILSVGGGDQHRNISANLVSALHHTKEVGASILGIVGRDGGFTARVADACVIVPTVNQNTITPHTESFQSLLLHLIVSHPKLKAAEMKWESSAAQEHAA